jgi:hypothetical protein
MCWQINRWTRWAQCRLGILFPEGYTALDAETAIPVNFFSILPWTCSHLPGFLFANAVCPHGAEDDTLALPSRKPATHHRDRVIATGGLIDKIENTLVNVTGQPFFYTAYRQWLPKMEVFL